MTDNRHTPTLPDAPEPETPERMPRALRCLLPGLIVLVIAVGTGASSYWQNNLDSFYMHIVYGAGLGCLSSVFLGIGLLMIASEQSHIWRPLLFILGALGILAPLYMAFRVFTS